MRKKGARVSNNLKIGSIPSKGKTENAQKRKKTSFESRRITM